MNLQALFGTLGLRTIGKRLLVIIGLVNVVSVRFEPIEIHQNQSGLLEVSSFLNGAFTEEMAEMLVQSTDIGIRYVLIVYADSGKTFRFTKFKGLHYASLTGLFSSLAESDEVFSTKTAEEALSWFSSCEFTIDVREPFTALLKAALELPGDFSSGNPGYLWRGAEPFVSVAWPE